MTLFAALAPLTKHLGFIATASTTYEEPYNTRPQVRLARPDLERPGRLERGDRRRPSRRRTTSTSTSSIRHAFRYARAREHVEVVKTLWDSFEDDAFIRDKETGVFFDTGKVHYTDHRGEHFKVKGPLNVPRSPQGHPVIVQAGQSDDGRGLAAATAEVIFTAHQHLDTAQEFYRDIKARAVGARPRSRPCPDHAGRRALRRPHRGRGAREVRPADRA